MSDIRVDEVYNELDATFGPKKDSELTMKEAFARLDSIIEKMQSEDIPLEMTYGLYKRGLDLVELCNKKIEKVEKDISKVTDK